MMQNMIRRSFLLSLLVMLALFPVFHIFHPDTAQAAIRGNLTETRILVITSQPYATEWFNSFNSKFVEEIGKLVPVQPKISYEYIDGEIAADPEMSATMVAFLKKKYDWKNIDLVIGVMAAGSTFLLEYGDRFTQGVPQLFVLPSAQQVQKISARPSVGIIASTGDAISSTLKNIRAVLPETKTLYVVAGVGSDDREYFSRAQRTLTAEKMFENVIYLTGLDSAELLKELSTAPPNSAVMFLTYVMNNHGQPISSTQVLRAVSPQTPAPIFGFYDTVFGSGIVGGNLTSSEAYGEISASAARRLLNGEKEAFSLSVPPRNMYDWRELKRWKIDESKLPEGSQVKYVQYSLWDLYKWHIAGAILLLALQGFLIFTLLINRARLRSLEKALRLSNIGLEAKVGERTAELTASNEKLLAANQELTAMNEQLTDMNEKMAAMNETLDSLNHRMASEISDRQAMEKVLASTNIKLKELDRLKSLFIASMSHEFRTPLNSIIGFTGMTLQGLSGPLNEEQQDNLRRVKTSANHLLALITDVIDISKIESGKVDSYPQSFALSGLVAEAVDTVRAPMKEKGMTLEVCSESEITMFTDRRRLLQCLINLLSNAVKYSESGKITINVQLKNGVVDLSVTDTGIGIAAEDLPKLFEPFERVKSHLQIKAGGTGLGLYLTKKLVTDILSGEITVESVKGTGSTFRIRVPETLQKEAPTNENGADN